jgi:hypothetical protein
MSGVCGFVALESGMAGKGISSRFGAGYVISGPLRQESINFILTNVFCLMSSPYFQSLSALLGGRPSAQAKPRHFWPVAVFLSAFAGQGQAIEVAGGLLVDLSAADFTTGATTWNNNASLGAFTATGTPTSRTINGAPAVFFDGHGDYFSSSVTTSSATTIEGSGDRTVEVWVWNANAHPVETMVSWGQRGATGTLAAFGYGTNSQWGAVDHWSTPAIGWDSVAVHGAAAVQTANIPQLGQWNHLTYVQTGTQTRVYTNGVLSNSENATINTTANRLIRLGAVNNTGGAIFSAESNGGALTGGIGQVRIHEGALTAAQIATNYNLELSTYNLGPQPAASLTSGPAHRYSFDMAAGALSSGTVLTDSAGGAHGHIRGAGAVSTGSQIDLPGGSSATQAYIDLPNGLISTGGSAVTIEMWVTVSTNQTWSKLLDIGSNTAGEVTGPGGAFNGNDYLSLSANSNGLGTDQWFQRVGAPLTNGGDRRISIGNDLGSEVYYTLLYDDVDKEWRHYENGRLFDAIPSIEGPSGINDINVWLGRSNWAADANLDGNINEFRVYHRTLTDGEILRNFADGPDLITIPEPSAAALVLMGLAASLRRRRAGRKAIG